MGRLAGFRYREVARRLRRLGYRFDRTGPEATKCGVTREPTVRSPCRVTPETAEGTLRAVLREAGIDVHDFLLTD